MPRGPLRWHGLHEHAAEACRPFRMQQDACDKGWAAGPGSEARGEQDRSQAIAGCALPASAAYVRANPPVLCGRPDPMAPCCTGPSPAQGPARARLLPQLAHARAQPRGADAGRVHVGRARAERQAQRGERDGHQLARRVGHGQAAAQARLQQIGPVLDRPPAPPARARVRVYPGAPGASDTGRWPCRPGPPLARRVAARAQLHASPGKPPWARRLRQARVGRMRRSTLLQQGRDMTALVAWSTAHCCGATALDREASRGTPQQLVGARRDQRAAPAMGRRPHVAALARPPGGVAPHQPAPARAQRCLHSGRPGVLNRTGGNPACARSNSACPAPRWRCLLRSRAGPRQPVQAGGLHGAFQHGQSLSCTQAAQLRKHGTRQPVPTVCTVAAEERQRSRGAPTTGWSARPGWAAGGRP